MVGIVGANVVGTVGLNDGAKVGDVVGKFVGGPWIAKLLS